MPPDKNVINPETAFLLKKYREDYPMAPDPAKVWTQSCKNNFKRELDQYNNGDDPKNRSKIPRYFAEIGPLKYQNFVKHVLKHQRQLELVSVSVHLDHERNSCEKLYADFEEDTDLKSAVLKAIMGVTAFQKFSSDWTSESSSGNLKTLRELLLSDETELQVILKPSPDSGEKPSEKVKAEGHSLHDLWKDIWHPINLTISFDMFKRFVDLFILQRKDPLKEFVDGKGHENTYKRHYLKHMLKTAESNQEFLLAVISFGTDVRFFPSKILEFLQVRGMLKDEYNAYRPKTMTLLYKDFTFSKAPDSVVRKRNADFLKKFAPNPLAKNLASKISSKPQIQIVKLIDLTEDVEVNNFNDKSGKAHEAKKSSNTSSSSISSRPSGSNSSSSTNKPKTTTEKSLSTQNQNKSDGSGQPKLIQTVGSNVIKTLTHDGLKSSSASGTSIVKRITIKDDEFWNSTRKLWQMFYEPGYTLPFALSVIWYTRYSAHVREHKIDLNNCVGQLLQDRHRSCHFDIPRLHPSIIESVKSDFIPLELARRAGHHDMSTVEKIMFSQTSPLQLALQDSTINKSVPGPSGWSPTNCDLPYQAFEGHLEWRLKDTGKTLDGLEIEMVKLRYVEYLSFAYKDSKRTSQFILGIFTAYGPDLYLYPTRVLQLLKKKQLLRSGSTLQGILQVPVDGRLYSSFVPINSSAASSHSQLGGPPPFANIIIPCPVSELQPPYQSIPAVQGPPEQPTPHLRMDCSFEYDNQHSSHFPPPPHQYSHQGFRMVHYPNGYNGQDAGVMGGPYGQDPYQTLHSGHYLGPSRHTESQFPQPVPSPSQSVPPPASNNLGVFSNGNLMQQRQEPTKSSLPSVLPLENWRLACERSLSKYGPKYGIQRLSDKDYKVLYDRYLFDTFDNPDDFVRGILTGISLAKYPRDDEEPISTSGLLKLPATPGGGINQMKSPLKPILKSSAPPTAPVPTVTPNSISMSREDLIRVSTLLEKLIPNTPSATASSSVTTPALRQSINADSQAERPMTDYGHEDEFASFRRPKPLIPPTSTVNRRNYDEEEKGYEAPAGRIIDYDHLGSRLTSFDYFRRPGSGSFGSGQAQVASPIKRPALPRDVYEDDPSRPKRMNTGYGSFK